MGHLIILPINLCKPLSFTIPIDVFPIIAELEFYNSLPFQTGWLLSLINTPLKSLPQTALLSFIVENDIITWMHYILSAHTQIDKPNYLLSMLAIINTTPIGAGIQNSG